MKKPITPPESREIAKHLFYPDGDNGYVLKFLADQVKTLTKERDTLMSAAKLALEALEQVAMHPWLIQKEPHSKDKYYVAKGSPPRRVLEIYGITQVDKPCTPKKIGD